ncbi:hypothetical protein ACLMJK_006599 [Lecanora helva]
MVDNATPSSNVRNIEPDPSGDLVLILGDPSEQTYIRVSSKILSIASPVLAAMLGPKYAEGNTLSTTGSLELTLPEDDPEAMVWVCNIVHLKQSFTHISVALMEKIAVTCDKYDMSGALSVWGEAWLSHIDLSTDGEARYGRLLWIAYALGCQTVFYNKSYNMIWYHTEAELRLMKEDWKGTSIPEDVLKAIMKQRKGALKRIFTAIDALIAPFVRTKCHYSEEHSNKEACFHLAETGHFFQELLRCKLWPFFGDWTDRHLEQTATNLGTFKEYLGDFNSGTYYCTSSKRNFLPQMKPIAEQARKEKLGLCLNCIKQGKITTKDGNCSASRIEECVTNIRDIEANEVE